jgi:hypothetical protein
MPTDELENELRKTLARTADFEGLDRARQRLLERDYHPRRGTGGWPRAPSPARLARHWSLVLACPVSSAPPAISPAIPLLPSWRPGQ